MLVANARRLAVWLPCLLGSHARLLPPEEEQAVTLTDISPSLSPAYPSMFKVALPIPPVKEATMKVKNPVTGEEIVYYEITVKPFTQQVYPNLPATSLVGYDGMWPGPTIVVPKGTETVIRFLNNATLANAVHLHGGHSRAPWDGWSEDLIEPGQFKDYYYPNYQTARTIWYHDHGMHVTAENAYKGQAGAYVITDADEDALGLPSGYGQFDIPLILTSKRYDENAALVTPAQAPGPFYGDVFEVNGQPWPFLKVEPRKYRFRMLDGSVGRTFALYFALTTATDTKLPFKVIASDSGLLEKPVDVSEMYIAMGERYEIVFDFSKFAGKTIELRNLPSANGLGTEVNYANTDKVMRFEVAQTTSQPDTSTVPAKLRTVPFPPSKTGVDHSFRFQLSDDETWLINGVGFSDVENRVLANVPLNTVEIWEFRNDLINGAPNATHPIHVHMVEFKVLSRKTLDGSVTVPREVMPYEAAGLKDVVWLAKNETVQVEAHYAPWPGVYVFHCHNLIHEGKDQMAVFNITVLDDFGYNATSLVDPMAEKWRPKKYANNDVAERTGLFSKDEITSVVQGMASYKPHTQPQE